MTNFSDILVNDSHNYIKNKSVYYFVSTLLPDDPVSFIVINYNICY